MSYGNTRGVLNQYNQLATETGVSEASPHRLIQMLLEGALEKLAAAKGYLERGNMSQKSRHISWAASIIHGLRMSLDLSAGGELAANLDALYVYMGQRLIEANKENSVAIVDEVADLLKEIKAGWDALPEASPPAHAGVGGDKPTVKAATAV